MSRSRKKAIVTDKNKAKTQQYHRKIRRVTSNILSKLKYDPELDIEIPDEKTIVNDYDYSDYKFDYEHDNNYPETKKKLKRK